MSQTKRTRKIWSNQCQELKACTSAQSAADGCSNPANTWHGEAADLATAAAAMTAEAGGGGTLGAILAISCSILLLPEHNLSHLIEHALLRGGDVCFFSCLNSTDIQIDMISNSSYSYGRVLTADLVPAPPLHGIEVS